MQPDVGSRKRAQTRAIVGTTLPAEPNTPPPGSSTRLCQLQQKLCPRQQQVPKAQENETYQKVDQQVVLGIPKLLQVIISQLNYFVFTREEPKSIFVEAFILWFTLGPAPLSRTARALIDYSTSYRSNKKCKAFESTRILKSKGQQPFSSTRAIRVFWHFLPKIEY